MSVHRRGDRRIDASLGTDPAAVARFFDAISPARNDLFLSRPILAYEQEARSRSVLDAVAAGPGDAILDIGCGNARDIPPMIRQGATIVGLDLSKGMLEEARRDLADAGYLDVRLEIGDATRMTFAAATFDKIVCSEVIEHIPDADRAISEMYRVLKPGGSLVMSTPNAGSWYGFDRFVLWNKVLRRKWNHPYDTWRNMNELRSLLEGNGFRVSRAITVCYVPGFVLTYFLPSKALQRLLIRLVRILEPAAARVAPRRGYLLVVTAMKEA